MAGYFDQILYRVVNTRGYSAAEGRLFSTTPLTSGVKIPIFRAFPKSSAFAKASADVGGNQVMTLQYLLEYRDNNKNKGTKNE